MKRVVAYLRVSTEGQVEKYGLDAQERDIRVYCSKHDMDIIEWRIEKGVSGAKEERPEFDKILYVDVENPPCEAVIVAKNDRVARDINIYYYYKMLLKKKGIDLISVAEDFGEMGIMAHFLEAFTLCVAEMERDNIKKRTSAGRMVKVKSGGYAGGRVPYGYVCVDGKLVVSENEAQMVRRVFELRKAGVLLKDITDDLIAAGYKTKSGKDVCISTVQNILKNEDLYRGKVSYGGVTSDGVHEKIL